MLRVSRISLAAVLCSACLIGPALAWARESSEANAPEDAAYWKVVSSRARKIVDKIGLGEREKADRVSDIIARQYQALNRMHEERDAAIAAIKGESADGKEIESQIATLRRDADLAVRERHYHFLAQLAAELTPVQIEEVKDGMTYGVLPLTYHRYTQLLPDLEDEHMRYIYSALVEAREFAMDEGSSDDKHRRFGKYKGRINNYLSKLGVDMKEAERVLAEKEKKK